MRTLVDGLRSEDAQAAEIAIGEELRHRKEVGLHGEDRVKSPDGDIQVVGHHDGHPVFEFFDRDVQDPHDVKFVLARPREFGDRQPEHDFDIPIAGFVHRDGENAGLCFQFEGIGSGVPHSVQAVVREDMETRHGSVTTERNLDSRGEPPDPEVGVGNSRRKHERRFRDRHFPGNHLHLLVGQAFSTEDNSRRITRERQLGEGVNLPDADLHRLFNSLWEQTNGAQRLPFAHRIEDAVPHQECIGYRHDHGMIEHHRSPHAPR